MKNILVTPSFAPDFQRCKLLVESANRMVGGLADHYLLIDRKDEPVFAPLTGGRVHLMYKEELLPDWLRPIPLGRNWWFSSKGIPVRGWILQQVVKLAVAEVIDADAFVYADSDVCFVRPWDINAIWQGDNLRLFREKRRGVMLTDRRNLNWYRVAAKYAGIDDHDLIQGGYIAQLNSWRRDHVLALLAEIERISSRPWKEALLGTLDFSEFILYGAFVESRLQSKGHFCDERPLTLSSWYHDVKTVDDLPRFLEALEPHHVGVHIQSNLHLNSSDYETLLRWR